MNLSPAFLKKSSNSASITIFCVSEFTKLHCGGVWSAMGRNFQTASLYLNILLISPLSAFSRWPLIFIRYWQPKVISWSAVGSSRSKAKVKWPPISWMEAHPSVSESLCYKRTHLAGLTQHGVKWLSPHPLFPLSLLAADFRYTLLKGKPPTPSKQDLWWCWKEETGGHFTPIRDFIF